MADIYDDSLHAEHEEEHHGGSFKLYWGIAVILGAATIIEVLLADFMKEQGVSGGIIAGTMMAIAIFKAAQVVLFYMHLKYEKRFLWIIFFIPFFLVSLLALTLFVQP
ncbi:MAG: cytochrome C oxidase subunit IV family protein [Chloroflexota bacterium]|nr:cytochrome C oxidase subunit IV family protein [Chloroflexota bacterium]